MGSSINAFRQPGHDRDTGLDQAIGQITGEATGGCRGVSGADDRDHWLFQKLQSTLPEQDRWRIAKLCQQSRIARVIEKQKPCTETANRIDLGVDLLGSGNPWRPSAAPSGHIGDRLERARRRTKSSGHLLICDRSDILGSDKPEPVKRVLAVPHSLQAFFDAPIFGSSPAIRRSILERCFHSTNRARPMNMGIMAYSPKTKAAIGTDIAASIPPTEE